MIYGQLTRMKKWAKPSLEKSTMLFNHLSLVLTSTTVGESRFWRCPRRCIIRLSKETFTIRHCTFWNRFDVIIRRKTQTTTGNVISGIILILKHIICYLLKKTNHLPTPPPRQHGNNTCRPTFSTYMRVHRCLNKNNGDRVLRRLNFMWDYRSLW